jgi:uncharacterized protein with HEPN domain
MKKDPLIFLFHINESIQKIERFLGKGTKEEFLKDEELQDAIVRRLEVIGEAVKNLPLAFRNKYSNVPWSDIAGMRDKLTHHYFGINLEVVWKVLGEDISSLKENVVKIIEKEKGNKLLKS